MVKKYTLSISGNNTCFVIEEPPRVRKYLEGIILFVWFL